MAMLNNQRVAQIRGITLFWYVPILIASKSPIPTFSDRFHLTIHLAELEYNYQYTNSLTGKHMKIAVIILTYQNILYTNHHSSDVTTWGYDGIHPAGLPGPNPHWAAQTPTQTQDVHQMPRTGSYASSRFGWVNWSTGPVEHLDHKMFIFSWISNFQVPSSNTISVDWWMVYISTQMR